MSCRCFRRLIATVDYLIFRCVSFPVNCVFLVCLGSNQKVYHILDFSHLVARIPFKCSNLQFRKVIRKKAICT